MTSVLSLTVAASADYTFASSTLLFSVGNSASAIDLANLSELASQDVGALWVNDGTTVRSLPSATWTAFFHGSLQYDTGSWSDANSVGLLRVPNDKWEYVEIGGVWAFRVNQDGATRIISIAGTSNSSIPYPYETFEDAQVTDLNAVPNYSIVKVSSGDVFQMQGYVTGGGEERPSSNLGAFWIRGVKARG